MDALTYWPDKIDANKLGYPSVVSYTFADEDVMEPVTLQEAKDWCAIDGSDQDTKVAMLLKAARIKMEKMKRISLINRTVTAKIKPGTNLPFGPVKSITSIVDQDGGTYTDYVSPYTLDEASVSADTVFTVVYEAGPGASLDDDYKVEILQKLAWLLENRGDSK